jgi:hypothetical protein
METQHKKFILSNLITLLEFGMTNVNYMYQLAMEGHDQELSNKYKCLYNSMQQCHFQLQELIKLPNI